MRSFALAVAVLAFAGCGDGEAVETVTVTETATETSGTETQTTPATEEAAVVPGMATCETDATASDPFELTFTRLVRTNNGLLVEWETNRPMPPSGEVLYVVDAFDEGDVFLQLGVKYLDDAQIAFYVFDSTAAYQTNLDGGAIRNGKRIEATFPQDAIDDLEGRFRWLSALNVRGDDVSSCPAQGRNPLGRTLPFPR